MKLNLLVATSQLNSKVGNILGTGTSEGLASLARIMAECGINGDIYDLPNGIQNPDTASPFSLSNGFALKTDELAFHHIPELQNDPQLMGHIQKISDTHHRFFRDKRTVNYALKRSIMPWILEACFQNYQKRQYEHRLEQFEAFQAISHYWLDDYALYEAYKEAGKNLVSDQFRQKESRQVLNFISGARERIDYFKYQQFLCFEQKQAARLQIKKQGIGLFVNLPFGVELESADVYFHPEVFDTSLQVGCSPEPEHGYPEQAWGIAAYREKSDGLRVYLEEKMKWLSLLGDGIFLDHMVGWCGQYVLPMIIPDESAYPHGDFLTTDHEERKSNIQWFLEIVLQTGLEIRGEIAGDHKRVLATVEAVEEVSKTGHEIGAMAIPRWETVNDRLKPLSDYGQATLTMVETHDTSTLLQYLLNRKGYTEDFESLEKILAFCQRVIGLPFFSTDTPLDLDVCDNSFWLEVCRRFTNGSPSREVVFTLPGLISLLSGAYRSATIENNINIKPGTSGAVGNGWGNWSYFSPPIEVLQEDSEIRDALTFLGNRSFEPFDPFHHLQHTSQENVQLEILYSTIQHRGIIHRNSLDKWAVWEQPAAYQSREFELELVIKNVSEEELWERIDLSDTIDLDIDGDYLFLDLNDQLASYTYHTQDLKANRLFVRLAPEQVHHFLVSKAT